MPRRRYIDDWEWRDLVIEASLGNIAEPNNYSRDAFGRSRTSDPYTLFDSKSLGDARSLFWATSAIGTASSAYNFNRSSVTIATSAGSSGTFIRQTWQRFNYQPGKSHLIITTNVLGLGVMGVTKKFGYFDENNGIFFQQDANGLYVGVRSERDGTAVDTIIPSSSWNLDTVDGTTNSGATIDATKSNIYFFDLEWLGVGEVRYGVIIGGAPIYVHQQQHANIETGVYMRTPNLPLRYEITSDGTGGAASIEAICNTVISEGGQELTGVTLPLSTNGTSLSCPVANTLYAMFGVRLKSTHLDSVVKFLQISVIAISNDDFEWQILLNPTVAGTFTYNDIENSSIQAAIGNSNNVVSGGVLIASGWGKAGQATDSIAQTLRYIGTGIDGTPEQAVLCIRSLTTQGNFQGTLWRIETP